MSITSPVLVKEIYVERSERFKMTTIILDTKECKVYTDKLGTATFKGITSYREANKVFPFKTQGKEGFLTGAGDLSCLEESSTQYNLKGCLPNPSMRFVGTTVIMVYKEGDQLKVFSYKVEEPSTLKFWEKPQYSWKKTSYPLHCNDRFLLFGSGEEYARTMLQTTCDITEIYRVTSIMDSSTGADFEEYDL